MKQKYTSAKTCVNHVPRLHRAVDWTYGDMGKFCLDYGGGKYEAATMYLADRQVTNLIYDPFNRSEEHNENVLKFLKTYGGADVTLCSNVLNVIKEKDVRLEVLKHIKSLMKPYTVAYFSVYRGEGNRAKKTCNGWQNNKPLKWYLPEIEEVFGKARIYNGYIWTIKDFLN